LFGHIWDKISNNSDKKYIGAFNGAQQGLKICGQRSRGYEASNEGCNSGPTRHDFTDIFNNLSVIKEIMEVENFKYLSIFLATYLNQM
jgi:hypothetical protein